MRLDRLVLVRFGHFNDFTFDFGSSKCNHDFHVIYGDNEAGKSTSYNALLDLLFGISTKPDYSFRHGRNALRIDATLSTADRKIEISRLKSGLYDNAEAPLNESVLNDVIRGLTRETYGTMFSMDEETLEQGGKDIIASKGDLATLLFSAAAGLGSISQRLDNIIENATYYRPNGRNMPLKNDLNTLSDLSKQLDTLDTRASEFRAIEHQRLEIESSLESVNTAIKSHQSTMTLLEKKKNAAGIAKRLHKCHSQRERYQNLPKVPRQWWTELQTFVRSTTEARNHKSRLENALSSIAEAFDAPTDIDPVIHEKTTIQQLQDMQKETLVLEKRIASSSAEFENLSNKIALLRKQLPVDNLPDSSTPLFRAGEASNLKAELRKHLELRTLVSESLKADESAKKRKSSLLEALPEKPADPAPLQRILNAINTADNSSHPYQLIEQAAHLEAELSQRLLDLSPWQGDREQLRQLYCPETIQIDNLDKALEQALGDQKSCLARQQQAKRQLQAKTEELALIESQNRFVDRKLLSDTRDALWSQWDLHQQQISNKVDHESLTKTASQFERLLKTQDQLWSQKDANSESENHLKIAQNILSAATTAFDQTNQDLELADSLVVRLQSELEQLNHSLKLPKKIDLQSLKSWLIRREETLRLDSEWQKILASINTRQNQRNVYADRIREVLNAYGLSIKNEASTLEELMEQADNHLSSLNASISNFKIAEQQISDQDLVIKEASAHHESLTQKMQSWERNWEMLVRDNCLKGVASEEMQQRLELLVDLDTAQQKILLYSTDRKQLESIRDLQHSKLSQLPAPICEPIDNTSSIEVIETRIRELGSRLELACKQVERREELSRQQQDIESQLAELVNESSVLFEDFEQRKRILEVSSMEDLQMSLNDCEKRDELDDQINELTLELKQLTDIQDSDSMLSDCLEFDASSIDLELDAKRRSIEALLRQRDEHLTTRQTLINKLDAIGSSNEVARLDEERSNLRLYIQEQTRETMKSRLGVAAAREGMRQYREAHQSNMLKQAGNIFRQITGGNFTRLTTQPDKKQRELLFAETRDGDFLEADKLSKGTRFQLFLALRLAAYKDYASSTVPLPFVADDILDAFDNQRSAESLQQFHEISQTGQVIYLTHHKHIVDLAKEVSNGTVCIHELPSRKQHIA